MANNIRSSFKQIGSKASLVFHLYRSEKAVKQVVLDKNITLKPIKNDVMHYFNLWFAIGKDWDWNGRITNGDTEIIKDLNNANHFCFEVLHNNIQAGLIEYRIVNNNAEILYFGVKTEFMGKGLGSILFDYMIMEIAKLKPYKIWLHTCSLDSPQALPFYRHKGFEVTQIERAEEPVYEKV